MSAAAAICRLTLAGFRSYAAAQLGLDARPVVIFGANGAGKTNLIEAVSLLSPGRGLRRTAGDALIAAGRDGWRITADVVGADGPHEIETSGAGTARRVVIDGKAAAQAALGEVLRVLWLTPEMDRLWMDAPAERRRFLDRIAMSLLPGHAAAAVAYEHALRERNRLLREGVRDRAWFDALERQMGEHGAKLVANREAALARVGALQAPGPFPAAGLALETEAPAEAAALATALAESRTRDAAAGRTLIGPHRDDLAATYLPKGVPARLCSTGEQKALLLSLTLANAMAVAADWGAVPVLLLDEVAAHLDAGRRRDLFEALQALGAQAWMTGTGRALFEDVGERAQWLRVLETGAVSHVAPAALAP